MSYKKNTKKLLPKPPVVVIVGHIDHGKSTLLDYIRKTNLVSAEVGGITQHLGAYQVEHVSADKKKHSITFLDTPGHEAFAGIRERGVKSADIAILAVSAEDGVKPQTVQAFKTIKAGNIPFIVAITKIDKPNADPNKTRQSLGENEIYIEGWGGDVPCVEVSSVTGVGISELLDMIVLVSDMNDLKYDPSLLAEGFVIESKMQAHIGIYATLMIREGTLSTSSFVVSGSSYAPVRFIENFQGIKIASAVASMPVFVTGWNEVPVCGDTFRTVKTKKEAEGLVEQYLLEKSKIQSSKTEDENQKNVTEKTIVTLPIIIKADTVGGLQGVQHELSKISQDKVQIKIVLESIGEINENDVKLVLGNPEIVIIGFNVMPDKKAAAMIERAPFPINIGSFNVIYRLTEFVQEILFAKIPKEYEEQVTGSIKIIALFSKEKDRQVIGGKVEKGVVSGGVEMRIMRRGVEISRGRIRELQEKRKRVGEVAEGHECGLLVESKQEVAVSDRLEIVSMLEKK